MKTEDQVRDAAKLVLGFNEEEKGVVQNTGQLTTFNQLGFPGINFKPDGWYLPDDVTSPAIIFEAKSESENLSNKKWEAELLRNIKVAQSKYHNVIGILYNSADIRVYKGNVEITQNTANTLQRKEYYLKLFSENKIDKQKIYGLTKLINDCLHIDFGIKNLYHRMIFTACALVAKRYGAVLIEGMSFASMKASIIDMIKNQISADLKKNNKLDTLIKEYDKIELNSTTNQKAINNFIKWVSEISNCVNSDYWNGEDVMGIFFNEFNRYKKKSESGQIFTPDHITSLMYRLLDVHKDDYILDAACGSGAFLVKSMCNMIREAGGVNSAEAGDIKSNHLFGIEFDKEIFALACANMLIHKDGKTNLEQLDSRTEEAINWIKSKKKITKVMMNPPYERKYGCMKIVKNVLDSVPKGTHCAFILPDKKLEKDLADKTYGNKVLKSHKLTTIVKLPENLFFGVGVTTSIFIFESGIPQNNRDVIGYYIEDDGLETVKNQGRQDYKGKWQSIEDYWVKAIQNNDDSQFHTRQIIHPNEHLSYQMPEIPFELSDNDIVKPIIDYEIYKRNINIKQLEEKIVNTILYQSVISKDEESIIFKIKK